MAGLLHALLADLLALGYVQHAMKGAFLDRKAPSLAEIDFFFH